MRFAGEVSVRVPASLQFSLDGLAPNPALGDLTVAFTLPSSVAATLELFDVAGRRMFTRRLTGLASGR